MNEVTVTKENFQQEVLGSDRPVILDFWATWCGPCRMIAPTLERIAEEREDIKVCKVDVDEQRELALQFGIQSIPTLLIFENGAVKNQSVGVVSKDRILSMID